MTGNGSPHPCAFCGIHPENRVGIRVFSYTLLRSVYARERLGRSRTRSFGSLYVCDRCIGEKHRGASMVTAGFRSESRT